jgi:hypothetical protein
LVKIVTNASLTGTSLQTKIKKSFRLNGDNEIKLRGVVVVVVVFNFIGGANQSTRRKPPVKYFTLNSLSYHFSPFENENYYRFIISLQANNLTSLSPYATDLTSDR